MKKPAWLVAAFGALLCLGLGNCGKTVDCQKICSRYADCVEDDYDVDECRNSCEDEADKDDDYAEKVDDCESCIDDRSCADSIFPCADECIGIVP